MDRPDWRKASYSNGQASCIEIGHAIDHIMIRDTKQAQLGNARITLNVTSSAWQVFTTSLK